MCRVPDSCKPPSPSPWRCALPLSPAGRGNRYPASLLGRTSLLLAPCALRFKAETPARPSVLDSPSSGRRFSLSLGERAGVRAELAARPPIPSPTSAAAKVLNRERAGEREHLWGRKIQKWQPFLPLPGGDSGSAQRRGEGERLYLRASRDYSMPVNGASSFITIDSCPLEGIYNRWETSAT